MSVMMVEKSPYINTTGKLLNELNQATVVMNKLNTGSSSISQQEVNHLIKTFEQYNSDFSDKKSLSVIAEKSTIQQQMDKGIANYLKELEVFNQKFAQNNPVVRRDLGPIMAILFYKLDEEMKKLGKILRELKDRKKIKIGQKVEKSDESKSIREKK